MDTTIIRIVCALAAVIFLGLIILRRRQKAE